MWMGMLATRRTKREGMLMMMVILMAEPVLVLSCCWSLLFLWSVQLQDCSMKNGFGLLACRNPGQR